MTPEHLRSRLVDYLARAGTAPTRRLLGTPVVLPGGRASSLYALELGPTGPDDAPAVTSVLKLYAPDERGRGHATREWHALTRLRALDHPTPRGLLLEPDPRHLGRPFVLMEHIAGTSFWDAHESTDPVGRSRLTQSFVARLVALHDLDPGHLDPTGASTVPRRHLERELELLRRDGADLPGSEPAEVVRWLERRAPAVSCERSVIQHRDYHPWNVLVDTAEDLWVVDWDWRIGDARFDLAWTCTLMERSGFPGFGGAVREEYARRDPRVLDDLEFFEVLTTIRWLVNVVSSVRSGSWSDPAAREDFRAFLVEPVRRAGELLHEHTGIDVAVRP